MKETTQSKHRVNSQTVIRLQCNSSRSRMIKHLVFTDEKNSDSNNRKTNNDSLLVI